MANYPNQIKVFSFKEKKASEVVLAFYSVCHSSFLVDLPKKKTIIKVYENMSHDKLCNLYYN